MGQGLYTLDSFKTTTQRLQDEAISNTQIIEELAGLEKYISETYVSRVFYEIIQNADDCESERFHAFLCDQSLLLFNDGHAFSDRDLESLCRSAFSSKQRGVNIGYRGIGFKSVAGVCQMVSVISGSLEIFFSREKTHELLARDSRVPLLRVPHMGSLNQELTDIAKAYIEEKRMKTCIILHNADSGSLLNDLKGLNRTSISFLRNLLEIDINLESYAKTLIAARIPDSSKRIGEISQRDIVVTTKTLADGKETSTHHDMRLWNYRNIGISTETKDSKPLRLKKNEAYAQAFLPMLTTTGLGARINGDFSTDPSRTRINPDEFTKAILDDLVELVLSLLDRLCDDNISAAERDLLEVLIPYKNASVFDISPSYISEQIKDRIMDSDGILFSAFMLCPQWLKKKTDYKKLAKAGRYKTLSFDQVGLTDYESFFLSLGATKPGLPRVLELLAKTRLSSSGVISLWKHILYEDIRVTAGFKAIEAGLVQSANIFLCTDGIARSGSELANSNEHQLDIIFMASLFDMAGRSTDAVDMCIQCGIPVCMIPASLLETIRESLTRSSKAIHAEMLKAISPTQQSSEASNGAGSPHANKNALRLSNNTSRVQGMKNEPGWRDMERLAGSILAELGFDAEDVSKRNLGYDYTAYDKEDNRYCVEVKKTEGLGDDFILTDNEIYVAKDVGRHYWVLIIVQPDPNQPPTCYSIIKDFYRTFEKHMIRRCIKYQMFCSEYTADFVPLSFE